MGRRIGTHRVADCARPRPDLRASDCGRLAKGLSRRRRVAGRDNMIPWPRAKPLYIGVVSDRGEAGRQTDDMRYHPKP